VADEVEALEPVAADSEQSALAGKRVLIVDDNANNRLLLKLLTERWGMRARDTHAPAVALEWIVQGDPFDVALLDRRIRSRSRSWCGCSAPQAGDENRLFFAEVVDGLVSRLCSLFGRTGIDTRRILGVRQRASRGGSLTATKKPSMQDLFNPWMHPLLATLTTVAIVILLGQSEWPRNISERLYRVVGTRGPGLFSVNPLRRCPHRRAPGARERTSGFLLHHQARTIDTQLAVFKEITCDQAVLTDPVTAPAQIAQVLRSARIGSSGGLVRYRAGSTMRRAGQWRQIQEKAQDYSGFGLKLQTPTPKSAQLAFRAPVR
jgi:hypothetical protein